MIIRTRVYVAVLVALCVPILATMCLRPSKDERREKYRDALLRRVSGRDAVLVGNSVLQKGVDVGRLRELTGRDITRIWHGGSASAWWYLAVKNIILQAENRPDIAVICFRDTFLTQPDYRIHGDYARVLKAMSMAYEPEVEALAYGRSGSRVQRWLERKWRLYRCRRDIREDGEDALERCVESLFPDIEPGEFEDSAEDVFNDDRLDPELFRMALDRAENPEEDTVFDFEANVQASFLPLIIDLLESGGVRLVLVRMRKNPGKNEEHDTRIHAYLDGLRTYLAERGVPLIDYGEDKRLPREMFGSGDHLTEEGMNVFTRMLAEGLGPYLDNSARVPGSWQCE